MLIVQKFGGSSVADAERIRRVAGIIADAASVGDSPVVVLSAGGDTTDTLLENAGEITKKPHRRELDVLLSTGELSSVALMAMQLHSMGLDCVSLSGRQAGIFTDRVHGSARILNISTDMLRLALGGSQVLHSRSVEAAIANNVELTLLSSFTRKAGTVVSKSDERPPVCGVTRDKAANKISVVGAGVDAQTLAQTVAVLAENGIVVCEGELRDGVCAVTVSPENVLPSLELIHRHFFG